MRRWLYLVVVLGLVFAVGLSGCGDSLETDAAEVAGEEFQTTEQSADASETTAEPETMTTEAAADTTVAAEVSDDPLAQKFGATVDVGDLLITVGPPTDDTANLDEMTKEFMLEPGQKAIYCMVEIVNNGDEPFSYNTLGFVMYDSEGMTYDSLFPVSSQPDLGSGDLLPGRTVKGAISFAMPEGASPAYVDFQRDIFSDVDASWGN